MANESGVIKICAEFQVFVKNEPWTLLDMKPDPRGEYVQAKFSSLLTAPKDYKRCS